MSDVSIEISLSIIDVVATSVLDVDAAWCSLVVLSDGRIAVVGDIDLHKEDTVKQFIAAIDRDTLMEYWQDEELEVIE